MSRTEASQLHRLLAAAIGRQPSALVFKKTDSVLRGHVLAELDAWMDVLGFDHAVLQPANPAAGRRMKEGRYSIDDQALHRTGFADDPDFPAWTDQVADLLTERHGRIPPRALHTGPLNLSMRGIHLPDCTDVEAFDSSVAVEHPDVLHAGSAAFFEAWLRIVHAAASAPRPEAPNPLLGRFLMVCGSKHHQSEAYLSASKTRGMAVAEFPEAFLQESIDEQWLDEWADRQAEWWGHTGQMIVTQGHRPATFPGCARVLRNRLARIVHRMMAHRAVGELLLEGGASSFALLELQDWQDLLPLQEYAPGIVRMGMAGHPELFVTFKPGSYPWPDWMHVRNHDPSEVSE